MDDHQKNFTLSNFRSITCLPLSWKLLASILAEEFYEHLEKINSLTWEEKDAGKEVETQKINY